MPRYQPEDGEMEELYPAESPEGETETEAPEEGEMDEEAPEEGEMEEEGEEEESSSAIIDNAVLRPGGEPLKEGEVVTLVVVKNYGDESEVRLKPSPEGGRVQPPSLMEEANAELDAMEME
jgi:hypothetical protein